MAFFGVTKERIKSVSPIQDADRIETASLEGMDFQFVIGKGQFVIGEECLYFPVDSLLPAAVIEKLGLTGKLAGKDKNRIKTVKLRGQISQGIVSKLDIIPADLEQTSEKITEFLGITKYEPPEIICNNAKLLPLPDGLSIYDIESADRYVDAAAFLMDQNVVVTEKIEGTNFSVMAHTDATLMVNQRTKTIIPIEGEEHTFWKIAKKDRLLEFATSLAETYGKRVVVYGELIGPGIQGNIYKLPSCKVLLYDIKVGFEWLPFEEFESALEKFFPWRWWCTEERMVPLLFKGRLCDFLNGASIKAVSDGKSRLADINREGIVIRPLIEGRYEKIGRLILKQRSPLYLSKSEY